MQISGWVRDDVNCSCTADEEVRVCMIPGVDILLGCELSLFTTPFFSSLVPSVFSPINGRAVANKSPIGKVQ